MVCSFEQFCINFTNEKLQKHFNQAKSLTTLSISDLLVNVITVFNVFNDEYQHVSKMKQEDYTKKQIQWSYFEFVDNNDALDLVEKVFLSFIFLTGLPSIDQYEIGQLSRSET